jgi:hypothetical protein
MPHSFPILGADSCGLILSGWLTEQQLFQVFDDPLRRFAVPFQRNHPFFPLSCHQSPQRERQFARVSADEFASPNGDGLGTLGVVMQRENWLIVQVCLVYLDKPDEPTNDTKGG